MCISMTRQFFLRGTAVLAAIGIGGCKTAPEASQGVRGLPYAGDRVFYTLDDYLAYRRELGKVDRPYYELIGPNLYRLNTGRGMDPAKAQVFTREQLSREFGLK